jgi:multiple antibiotic resistance protein
MNILSTTILLLTIMDPLGNVPNFIAGVRGVPEARRVRVIARELFFALGIMLFFLFCGQRLLQVLQLKQEALFIGGGVMLFLIAIRMIFPSAEHESSIPVTEPFIVPLATPLIAGPSVLATLLVLVSTQPGALWQCIVALLSAWAITAVVLLFAPFIARVLKEKGAIAVERLMGMLLVMIAVQMFLNGLDAYLKR